MIDNKIANKESMLSRPLTKENVEKHLGDIGLESEYATHFRINALIRRTEGKGSPSRGNVGSTAYFNT